MGEGRGNAFIMFPKRGRKEIAVEAGNSRVVRKLRRRLYQEAKQDLRMPLDEDDRKAVFGKTERTVVCPAKAGVFSRGQSCYVRSQKTYSLDSKLAGNRNLEAYRDVTEGWRRVVRP